MESRILKPVLSDAERDAVFLRSHFNKEDYGSMCRVNDALRRAVSASAWYEEKKDAGGIVCIVTLGEAVDVLEETYQKAGELLKAYQLECLCMALLQKSYEELSSWFEKRYGGRIARFCFPGSDLTENISFAWMQTVLAESGQQAVTCNAACMLSPKKSVVFLAKLSVGCRQERSLCADCPRKECRERKQ